MFHLDDNGDAVQSLLEAVEGGALGEEHQQAVQGSHESRLFLRYEELQAEEREDRTLDELYQFVNLLQEAGCDLDIGKLLYQIGGVVIVLS